MNHWDNLDGTVERGYAGGSIFFADGAVVDDLSRVRAYARLLASVGINGRSTRPYRISAASCSRLIPKGVSDRRPTGARTRTRPT